MTRHNLLLPIRQLTKRPGIAVAIVLVMAAGIGVNAAVFSVVYAVLLKPLPYPDPQQLVFISGTSGTGERIPISLPDFGDWRTQQSTFANIAAYNLQDFNLLVNGETQRYAGAFVSANYFRTLGLPPTLGRAFLDSEDQSGSARVVILSARLWREQFGSDPQVLGRTIVINAITYQVIGIAPDQLMHPANIDVYASLGPFSNYGMWTDRGNPTLYVIGRLKTGVTLSTAAADLKLVCRNLESRFPDTNAGHSANLTFLLEATVVDYQTTLYLLLAAAGSVLIISSANVAGLQLIRVNDRRKEFMVKAALGASRWHLIRQLLTENLILSFIGAFLGILAAAWSQDVISALCPQNLPRFQGAGVDTAVIAAMLVAAAVTGVASGLFPAWKASQLDLKHTLKQQIAAAPTIKQNRSQKLLVIGQIALVTVLLAGTGFLIQTLRALQQVDLGFYPNNVLVVGLKLPGVRYRELPGDESGRQMANLYDRILNKVEAVSGVESAAINSNPPFIHTTVQSRWPFGVIGRPDQKPGDEPFAEGQSVSADYFRTIRLPLLRGRLFDQHDILGNESVVIVDRRFAEQFFPDQDPIGKLINDAGLPGERQQYRIVGIVPTVRHDELGAEPRLVQLYFPAAQDAYLQVRMLVRTNGEPNTFLRPIRDAVHAVDPEIPVFEAQNMTDAVSAALTPQRLAMNLISVFSLLALALAVFGLYALFLYQVTPMDLTTLLLTTGLLGTAAFFACLAPALRAANLDPIEAIRER
jgi:putative ABC transport system permease protein